MATPNEFERTSSELGRSSPDLLPPICSMDAPSVSAGQVRVEAPRQDIYAFQGRFSVRPDGERSDPIVVPAAVRTPGLTGLALGRLGRVPEVVGNRKAS